MIDSEGNLRCDNCGKKLGEHLSGRLEIVCPRCKHFNVFDTVVIKMDRVTVPYLTKQ